jgi:hypothetical protein
VGTEGDPEPIGKPDFNFQLLRDGVRSASREPIHGIDNLLVRHLTKPVA